MPSKKPNLNSKALDKGVTTHVGLYSKKYNCFDAIPENARTVIPNDPVNQGRALLLLQQAKLISLKDPKQSSI